MIFLAWPRRSLLDDSYEDPMPAMRSRAYRNEVLRMRERGHEVVDLLEVFRESGVAVDEIFSDEVHVSVVGARIVSEALEPRLVECLTEQTR